MDTLKNPSQAEADLQPSAHSLYSHFQKSSEAVSTDLDNHAHPRAPCRRCPLTAGGPHTLTPTQIMNQRLCCCKELTAL